MIGRLMIGALSLAALSLAACDPRAPVRPPAPAPALPPPPSQSPVPTAPQLAPVLSLAGEWRVAAIDDQAVEGSVGLALRADRDRIWWEPACAGFDRHYRIAGSKFSTSGYRKGEAPSLICLIAPPPQIGAVFVALAAATTIERTANNGVKISGGGHSLLLFSQ